MHAFKTTFLQKMEITSKPYDRFFLTSANTVLLKSKFIPPSQRRKSCSCYAILVTCYVILIISSSIPANFVVWQTIKVHKLESQESWARLTIRTILEYLNHVLSIEFSRFCKPWLQNRQTVTLCWFTYVHSTIHVLIPEAKGFDRMVLLLQRVAQRV